MQKETDNDSAQRTMMTEAAEKKNRINEDCSDSLNAV